MLARAKGKIQTLPELLSALPSQPGLRAHPGAACQHCKGDAAGRQAPGQPSNLQVYKTFAVKEEPWPCYLTSCVTLGMSCHFSSVLCR